MTAPKIRTLTVVDEYTEGETPIVSAKDAAGKPRLMTGRAILEAIGKYQLLRFPAQKLDPAQHRSMRLHVALALGHAVARDHAAGELLEALHRAEGELAARMQYIRNTGTVLIKSEQYGYRIEPVIGVNGWASMAEYNKERECLVKYGAQVVALLKRLGVEG